MRRFFWSLSVVSIALLVSFYTTAHAQRISGFDPYEWVEKDNFGVQFKNGDTNTPMLVMNWFGDYGRLYECLVTKDGHFASAPNPINPAWINTFQKQLRQTNLNLLTQTINRLPSPPKNLPPRERWLVVRGIRNNEWFNFTYDRAKVPDEVEKLYNLTGADLEWFFPAMQCEPITTNLNAEGILFAKNAPIAVLFASTNILVFDLVGKRVIVKVPITLIPVRVTGPWDGLAISPDGNILAESTSTGRNWLDAGVCAVDLKAKKVLWKKEPLEHDSTTGSRLIFGGDNGQYLFACGSHTVQRWDLATGKLLSVLATNQPHPTSVDVSQDGKVFATGFDDSTQCMPKSFTIWRANEDKPAAHIENLRGASASLSPDGQIFAIQDFGKRTMEFRDLEHGNVNEMPLRIPHGQAWMSQMIWSPKGTLLAAKYFGTPDTQVVYETKTWKPLGSIPMAPCGFDNNDNLYMLINGDICILKRTSLSE